MEHAHTAPQAKLRTCANASSSRSALCEVCTLHSCSINCDSILLVPISPASSSCTVWFVDPTTPVNVGLPTASLAVHMDESMALRLRLGLTIAAVLLLPLTFLMFVVALPMCHAILLHCARVRWAFWCVVLAIGGWDV